MNRRQFLRNSAALTLGSWAFNRAALAAAPTRKILFFSKSSGFEHSAITYKNGKPSYAERILSELGERNNWQLTFSKDGSLFNPTYLEQFDALIFYATGDLCTAGTDKNPPMTPEGKQAFIDYVASGKGFVGTHSASDTFHTHNNLPGTPERYKNYGDEADPYAKMLGGQFIIHGAQQMATMRVVDPTFPGFSKCGPSFDLKEEWYSLKDFQPDLHVLLVQETENMKGGPYGRPAYPATWARKHGQGRVFYTSMGHREEVWSDTIFQDILAGGVSWALGNVKADVTPNLNEVAPQWAQNPPFPPPKAPATPTPVTAAPPKG